MYLHYNHRKSTTIHIIVTGTLGLDAAVIDTLLEELELNPALPLITDSVPFHFEISIAVVWVFSRMARIHTKRDKSERLDILM